jgi:hypothetical protein
MEKSKREIAMDIYNAITKIDWEEYQFAQIKLAVKHKEEIEKLKKDSKGK